MLPNNLNLLPHEMSHYETLDNLASECTLFLKRDKSFPISNFKKVALFGSGVRYTAKGGTGSGDVNSHFFNVIEEEFELRGYEVTTKKWLDSYDELYKIASLLKERGIEYLRAGTFKMRTSPDSFQGLREEGMEMLFQIQKERVITIGAFIRRIERRKTPAGRT